MQMQFFHLWACPYCEKVRRHIEANGLEKKMTYRELHEDPEARIELKKITGESKVPCLVADGKPILESEQIIIWMQQNLPSKKSPRAAS